MRAARLCCVSGAPQPRSPRARCRRSRQRPTLRRGARQRLRSVWCRQQEPQARAGHRHAKLRNETHADVWIACSACQCMPLLSQRFGAQPGITLLEMSERAACANEGAGTGLWSGAGPGQRLCGSCTMGPPPYCVAESAVVHGCVVAARALYLSQACPLPNLQRARRSSRQSVRGAGSHTPAAVVATVARLDH
jgi:hypothetical protein